MRAVGITSFDGPDGVAVVELPEPSAGAGEVRVEVLAAPVNPVDVGLTSGRHASRLAAAGLTPPYVPGMEGAGIVESVGPEVTGWEPGDLVGFGVTPHRTHGGAQAELVVVPARRLVRLPSTLDPVAASLLPMNGLTAALAVERSGVGPGDRLLVTGAAGVVGGLVLQLAREAGAEVLALARTAHRGRLAQLGAGRVLDAVPADGLEVDAVVDAAVLGPSLWAALSGAGRLIALRDASFDDLPPGWRASFLRVTESLDRTDLVTDLVAQVTAGDLRLPPVEPVELASVAGAYRAVARGGSAARPVVLLGAPGPTMTSAG